MTGEVPRSAEQQYDATAADYERLVRPRYEAIAALVRDRVLRLDLPASPSVVEVAAGTGALTAQLAADVLARGGTYVATDVSAAMLAHARRGPGAFAVADAARLPLADRSVDCVVSSLGPLQDTNELLAEAHRVLAPVGWLVLSSWGDDYAEYRLLTEARRRLDLPPRPVVDAAQLTQRLQQAGLDDVHVEEAHLPVVHDSVEAYLDYRSSFGVVPGLTAEQHAAVAATIGECATPYLDEAGRLVLDWHVLVAAGRVSPP